MWCTSDLGVNLLPCPLLIRMLHFVSNFMLQTSIRWNLLLFIESGTLDYQHLACTVLTTLTPVEAVRVSFVTGLQRTCKKSSFSRDFICCLLSWNTRSKMSRQIDVCHIVLLGTFSFKPLTKHKRTPHASSKWDYNAVMQTAHSALM